MHGLTFTLEDLISTKFPLHQPPKETLRHLGLRPSKARGQHFLISHSVLQTTLSAAELQPDDVVVEVGPGLGILTRELAVRVRKVVTIEIDSALCQALRNELNDLKTVHLIHGDARQLDIEEAIHGEQNYKLVANLPYYAAIPILRRFLEAALKPTIVVAMVQHEVALSMCATPGNMALLSVGVQLYGRPRLVTTVPPSAFYPPPKVTSALVRIDVSPQLTLNLDNIPSFFDKVRAGFSAPRKQLRNALANGLHIAPVEVEKLLSTAGIDYRRRAETLSLEEWGSVYESYRVHWPHGDHQGSSKGKSNP